MEVWFEIMRKFFNLGFMGVWSVWTFYIRKSMLFYTTSSCVEKLDSQGSHVFQTCCLWYKSL